MLPRVLLVVFLLALPAVPVVSADWLQAGGQGGGTSVAQGRAPDWNDVAFSIPRSAFAPYDRPAGSNFLGDQDNVIVAGQTAYTTRSAYPPTTDVPGALGVPGPLGLNVSAAAPTRVPFGIFAIPLAAPVPHLIGNGTSSTQTGIALASDGARLFVAGDLEVQALPIQAGTHGWRMPIPVPDPSYAPLQSQLPSYPASSSSGANAAPNNQCPAMAADAHRLVLACSYQSGVLGQVIFLVTFDSSTGATTGPLVLPPSTGTDPARTSVAESAFITGLAVNGTRAALGLLFYTPYAPTETQAGCAQAYSDRVSVVDLGGAPGPGGAAPIVRDEGLTSTACSGVLSTGYHHLSAPILTRDALYFKNNAVNICPLPSGTCIADLDISPPGNTDHDDGSGMALADGRLYVPQANRAYALPNDLHPLWMANLPEGLGWGQQRLIAADSAVLGITYAFGSNAAPASLVAMDKGTGRVLWTASLGLVYWAPRLAVSDSLVLARVDDGLLALGVGPASPQIDARIGSLYPRPGDPSTIDLSGSGPGFFGAADRSRVDWGDGSGMSDWQAGLVLTHRYSGTTDRVARVSIANAANQTASLLVTFHPGQHDPAVTIWNSPFADEYQQTTYFVLGFLVTGLAALYGILRSGRKRRLFQRELRDLEDDYAALCHDARDCDAMLAKRKSAARALFLEKRLEEAHASFLERRVDELRRSLRLGTIEEHLKFLPYGMVLQLQKLLADGRVDAWERTHFLDALAQQRDLSSAQREQARRLIDDWFARDAVVTA